MFRKLILGIGCMLWCAASLLPAVAQEPAPAEVVLPPRLVTAQAATLAVLDAQGRLLPEALVEFSDGSQARTDATGRATFAAPEQPGILLARCGEAKASATVIRPPADARLRFGHVPHVVSLGDRFVVSGFGFAGQAERNRVTLGGQPAVVLAASPVALVLLPSPRAHRGVTELSVRVREETTGAASITVVALEVAAGKTEFAAGERGRLTVRVRGSEQRLELEARNLTPQVVRLRGGDVQRVVTSGGEDNTATLELEGRSGGEFAVAVRLIPQAAGAPDVEAVRQALVAARAAAPRKWRVRTDRLVQMLSLDPASARPGGGLQLELEKMLAEYPEGEFGRLLERAWRLLLGL